ncbi:unnamed protein product [Lampetra planeri]
MTQREDDTERERHGECEMTQREDDSERERHGECEMTPREDDTERELHGECEMTRREGTTRTAREFQDLVNLRRGRGVASTQNRFAYQWTSSVARSRTQVASHLHQAPAIASVGALRIRDHKAGPTTAPAGR